MDKRPVKTGTDAFDALDKNEVEKNMLGIFDKVTLQFQQEQINPVEKANILQNSVAVLQNLMDYMNGGGGPKNKNFNNLWYELKDNKVVLIEDTG